MHPPKTILPIEHKRTRVLLLLALMAASALAGQTGKAAAAESAPAAHADNRVLNNIEVLKAAKPGEAVLGSVEQLRAELVNLWDWKELGKRPLDVEIVESKTKDGYKVDSLYFNGYGDANGQDRIFASFARPETVTTDVPVYIELTGGGLGADGSLAMARGEKCAVMCIEWRKPGDGLRSKWSKGKMGTTQEMSSLKANGSFQLICGIRRAIDFLYTQPGIDRQLIGCGGGSMGGFYTLLAAGIDNRVTFGMDALAAGHFDDSDSRLGQIDLDPERKQIYLAAFDPHRYITSIKARMLMDLCSNDYYFWLGDGVADYLALSGEKRLCITPNANHGVGAFGQTNASSFEWSKYCSGNKPSYPEIAAVKSEGDAYLLIPAKGTVPESVTLFWSLGEDIPWPSRYWMSVPAQKTPEGWKAQIPSAYIKLPRVVFMNLYEGRGRTVSSVPIASQGQRLDAAGALWNDGALWDTAAGVSAWRPVGCNVNWPIDVVTVVEIAERSGLSVAPGPKSRNERFSLVSNSFILAGAQARKHRGLRLEVDGNGQPGELKVILVRQFGTIKGQKEYPFLLKYGAQRQEFAIPWTEFGPALHAGQGPLPFESLRLDGQRLGGKPLIFRVKGFMD
jgi:hypothetical protein